MMAASKRQFAKLDPFFHNNPKVIRAGRNGRDVYTLILCLNAAQGAHGHVGLENLEPWYLKRQLQIEESEARDGVEKAIAAGLIEVAGGRVRIVGWDDDWSRLPKSEAERSRDYRQRNGANVTNRHDERVTRHVTNTPSPIEREIEKIERESGADRADTPSRPSGGSRSKSGSDGAPFPDIWKPTKEHSELAQQLGCDLAHESAKFRAHYRANGHRRVDWDAAFEKWMRGSDDKGKAPKKGSTTSKPRRGRQQFEGVWCVEDENGDWIPENKP